MNSHLSARPAAKRTLWVGAAAALVMTYVLVAGLLVTVPRLPGLGQTSRNLFFHVPNWMGLYVMMVISAVNSVRYLATQRLEFDHRAWAAGSVAVLFGLMGLVTGMVWSRVTWSEGIVSGWDPSAWWPADPKVQMALAAILLLLAYLVLRQAVTDPTRRARLAAVYNLFAAATVIPLTYIIPRQMQSLHPGSADAGSPFQGDVADAYKLVFYPALIGYVLMAVWLYYLRLRLARAEANLKALR